MILFNCPHCNSAIKVSDEAAGKKGQCRTCSKTIHVPQTTASQMKVSGGPEKVVPPPMDTDQKRLDPPNETLADKATKGVPPTLFGT